MSEQNPLSRQKWVEDLEKDYTNPLVTHGTCLQERRTLTHKTLFPKRWPSM